MASINPAFSTIQTRYLYHTGDASSSAADAQGKSHINYSIRDILDSYPYSWSIKKTTGTLSSGTFSLATDMNPRWHVQDARIVNTSQSDDNIFVEVPLEDRDFYASGDYIWWQTYDTSLDRYIFNTLTQTGTVTYHYNFIPTDLSAAADVSLVPDAEAVALLAASKFFVADERNIQLSQYYEQKAGERIKALQVQDASFGPTLSEGTPIGYNSQLRGG